MTRQEVKLWVYLRSWKKKGFHFRRQSPRQGYIVDFVCMRQRLVIELDGGQHNEPSQQVRDVRRDASLSRAGFRTLRFWNNEIDRNLAGVLEVIDLELRAADPTRPASPATLPLRGRDKEK
jgi:very-short-patch-repair endonuclease